MDASCGTGGLGRCPFWSPVLCWGQKLYLKSRIPIPFVFKSGLGLLISSCSSPFLSRSHSPAPSLNIWIQLPSSRISAAHSSPPSCLVSRSQREQTQRGGGRREKKEDRAGGRHWEVKSFFLFLSRTQLLACVAPKCCRNSGIPLKPTEKSLLKLPPSVEVFKAGVWSSLV